MNYTGGKARQGPVIAQKLLMAADNLLRRYPHVWYFEPFFGAGGVARHVAPTLAAAGVRCHFSDKHPAVVSMWNAALRGEWLPPDRYITEEEYRALKAAKDTSDPMNAWAGFICTFSATYMTTFADRTNRPKAERRQATQRIAFLDKLEALKQATDRVKHVDFENVFSYGLQTSSRPSVIYLDPPYANSSPRAYGVGEFDSDQFWQQAQVLAEKPWNRLYVTEYEAPPGWDVVHDFGQTNAFRAGGEEKREKSERIWEWRP